MPPATPAEPTYPPEQVAFVESEAALDAERVLDHLRRLGLVPADGSPWWFPPGLLLDLAAALRLRAWDAAGLRAHLEAGLPTGESAVAGVVVALRSADGPPAEWGALARRVFVVTLDRLAWAARAELRAEVALEWPDNDGPLLDALASFLWANRQTPPEETP